MPLKDRLAAAVSWVQRQKAVRVFVRYGRDRGPILASGMAYQALFAVFAALWVGFSVAGFIVSRDIGLRQAIVDVLDQAVPGLIDRGPGQPGAIDPSVLNTELAFGISGIVALGGLLFTALGWLGAARASVRELFDLPPTRTNIALQKAIDLGIGLAFAVLLLLAAGLSVVGSVATEAVFGWLGIDDSSVAGFVLSRTATLVIAVIVYGGALAVLYRVLARVKLPWRILRGGILIGATGLAGLTIGGGLLLGGATRSPLIASFAVVAGLLIYYNFVSQVILIAASWMAVGADDAGVVLDREVFESRLEEARALVAAHEPEPEPERGFFARLFRRR